MYDTEGNSAEIQRNQLNMKIFLIELALQVDEKKSKSTKIFFTRDENWLTS